MNIFIKTGIVATIIFALGIFFGLWMGNERVSDLETVISELQADIDNAELQFTLADVLGPEVSCNYLRLTANELGKESVELAKDLERHENAQKITEGSFKRLKRQYTSVIISNWITLEKIKKTCDVDYNTLLFFYSNKACNACEDQGIVLSYLKDRLGGNLLVFALDSDLEMNTVNALAESYEITEYPAVVFNQEINYGFQDLETLTEMLCDTNNELSICQDS